MIFLHDVAFFDNEVQLVRPTLQRYTDTWDPLSGSVSHDGKIAQNVVTEVNLIRFVALLLDGSFYFNR